MYIEIEVLIFYRDKIHPIRNYSIFFVLVKNISFRYSLKYTISESQNPFDTMGKKKKKQFLTLQLFISLHKIVINL